MTDPATAYFFKKYYRNIIKWWFVIYNPTAIKIWPSKEEAELARQKELEEELALQNELEEELTLQKESEEEEPACQDTEEAFNATTGSYSGLYGQRPVDEDTQSALDTILSKSSSQSAIDSLFQNSTSEQKPASGTDHSNAVPLPPEQDAIIREANAIYERLLREAAEDEAKRAAEVEAARRAREAEEEKAASS